VVKTASLRRAQSIAAGFKAGRPQRREVFGKSAAVVWHRGRSLSPKATRIQPTCGPRPEPLASFICCESRPFWTRLRTYDALPGAQTVVIAHSTIGRTVWTPALTSWMARGSCCGSHARMSPLWHWHVPRAENGAFDSDDAGRPRRYWSRYKTSTPALPAPHPLNPSLYSLSNGCRFIVPDIVTGKPFSQVPFQANVELLRLFLTYREEIVEKHEAVLNAQRKPIQYLQGPGSFVPPFRGLLLCAHCRRRSQTRVQTRLRDQTGRSAIGPGGFRPRQVQDLHNDLIHPRR